MKTLRLLSAFYFLNFLSAAAVEVPLPTPAAPAVPNADDVLKKSATFFSTLDSLSTDIHVYWLRKSPGNTHEREADYHIEMQQPNKWLVTMKDGPETTYVWVCDGKLVQTYIAGMKKCTRHRAPGSIVDLVTSSEIETIKSTMENVMVLDLMLNNNPVEEFKKRFNVRELGGTSTINGTKAQTLKFIREDTGVHWDLAFADSEQPVPLQTFADLTSVDRERKPDSKTTIRCTFSNWKINTPPAAGTFQFTPPPGTEKVKDFFEPEKPSPLLNKPLPAARIQMLDGSHTDTAALRGKIVLLDFWQIHCIPCLYGMPKLDNLARQYGKKGVAIYAINEIDSGEDLKNFVKTKSWTSNLKLGQAGGSTSEKLGITETPISILIDKNGVVRSVHKFMDEAALTNLAAELDALIDGRDLPKPPPEPDDEP